MAAISTDAAIQSPLRVYTLGGMFLMAKVKYGDKDEAVRRIWDANAVFWNEQMGERNDFVDYLIWK